MGNEEKLPPGLGPVEPCVRSRWKLVKGEVGRQESALRNRKSFIRKLKIFHDFFFCLLSEIKNQRVKVRSICELKTS